MAAGARAASGSYAAINGTALCFAEWDLEFNPNLADVSTFCDGGYADKVATLFEARGNLRGFWNFTQKPHTDPPNIRAGNRLTGLVLRVSNAAGETATAYTFPTFVIGVVRVNTVIRDVVKLDFEFFNAGTFTYAT